MIAEKPEVAVGQVTVPRAPEPLPRSRGTAEGEREQVVAQPRRRPQKQNTVPWGRRQALALVVASFSVTLLCLYVSAYARVTAEGFDASRLTRQLNASIKEEEGLRANRDRLKLPDTVRQRAEELGMVRGNATTLYFLTGEGKVRADNLSAKTTQTEPTK